MGKKKITIAELTSEKNKRLTLNKRKKGLIKKAMELSILCDADVFIQISNPNDPKDTTIFTSNDLKEMTNIINRDIKHKKKSIFYKDDYENLFVNPLPKRKNESLLNTYAQVNSNMESIKLPTLSYDTSDKSSKIDMDEIEFDNCHPNENENSSYEIDDILLEKISGLSSTFSDLNDYSIQ